MTRLFRKSCVALLCFTLLTGVYVLLVTALSQLLFSYDADGSLQKNGDVVIGSELISQRFTSPKYFWGRPSAAYMHGDVVVSNGQQLSPGDGLLIETVKSRKQELLKSNPGADEKIPADLLMTSASGLDPHISPEAATWQVKRVARARGIDPEEIQELVEQHTQGRQWLVFGQPRVNVLMLNLALDRLGNER